MTLFMSVILVVVCTAMALSTALVQRVYLLGDLDQRVMNAAERSQGGLLRRSSDTADLGFLNERGQPVGILAARFDANGHVLAAEVVTEDGHLDVLTAAQRTALDGLAPDASLHTRTIPGLGTYRLTALGGDGISVLAGLPMSDVQRMTDGLVVVEVVIGAVGLVCAGSVCTVVVRRQLRPLGRVAATAAKVSRSPLNCGEAVVLSRVPHQDTDPATEVGQVGSALNRMIEHVESSLAERQRTEERMRRFLTDAGHELRTPLASIAGYAELMNRGTGKMAPELAWRRVSAQSARMTGLVEDLLLLARLDEGRPLRTSEVNVATLVAEAVWDARAAGSDHDWQVALRLDAPLSISGDQARLHQVLANLLTNARTHTPPGTRITVIVEATAAQCVVRVRDNGPGIPRELLPSVFERFTRADASRSRTARSDGGTGLGLAIAAAITQAHGGRIEVRSEPGDTEFTVTLPTAGTPDPEPSPGRANSKVFRRKPAQDRRRDLA
ncbi:ATP-binding protein [Streptomyces sp. NPDC052052]|uniref:HAMP domain-containing sensor histidine kinase n=1 Tax=Streptomyces sp. NPDC052052 TaxID=3154756 RepID=UPI00343B5EFF